MVSENRKNDYISRRKEGVARYYKVAVFPLTGFEIFYNLLLGAFLGTINCTVIYLTTDYGTMILSLMAFNYEYGWMFVSVYIIDLVTVLMITSAEVWVEFFYELDPPPSPSS